MATIGQQLSEARQDQDLTVEEVAHRTHIKASILKQIERDDFSQFASVAYARGFVKRYGEFLGVDFNPSLLALSSETASGGAETHLTDEIKRTIKSDRRFRVEARTPRPKKPGAATPLVLNLVLLALILGLVGFYFLGFKANSAAEVNDEIARKLEQVNPFQRADEAARSGEESESILTDFNSETAPETDPIETVLTPKNRADEFAALDALLEEETNALSSGLELQASTGADSPEADQTRLSPRLVQPALRSSVIGDDGGVVLPEVEFSSEAGVPRSFSTQSKEGAESVDASEDRSGEEADNPASRGGPAAGGAGIRRFDSESDLEGSDRVVSIRS